MKHWRHRFEKPRTVRHVLPRIVDARLKTTDHSDLQLMPEQSLHTFSQTRMATLQLLKNLEQQQVDYKPSPDKWSIGEVLDHVYLAEKFFRTQMQRLVEQQRAGRRNSLALSFSDLNVRPAFLPKCLLPLFEIPLTITNMFVPRSFRQLLLTSPLGRARHPDAADPRKNLTKQELLAQLTHGLAETRAIFEQNEDLDFSRLRISHPILGDNSVIELLGVMNAHERGHLQKIRETIRRLPSHLESAGDRSAAVSSQLI